MSFEFQTGVSQEDDIKTAIMKSVFKNLRENSDAKTLTGKQRIQIKLCSSHAWTYIRIRVMIWKSWDGDPEFTENLLCLCLSTILISGLKLSGSWYSNYNTTSLQHHQSSVFNALKNLGNLNDKSEDLLKKLL